MKALLLNLSVMGMVAAGAAWAMDSAFNLPEMQVSHSTGECVRVINHGDTNFTCERQPRKYHHVWVK